MGKEGGILASQCQQQCDMEVVFPTSRYSSAGCLERHEYLRDMDVELPSSRYWLEGVPTGRVPARWAPAGGVRLLRTRRRGEDQDASAMGGEVRSLAC